MKLIGGSKLLWFVRASTVRDYEIKAASKRASDAQKLRDELTRKR